MKKRFNEQQIIAILKEAEAGIPARELCRKHGISDATFYTWRKKYAGLDVSEARRLKALEDENARLKKLLAKTLLDAEALKIALSQKLLTVEDKRKAVKIIQKGTQLSERRACLLVGIQRASLRYQPQANREDDKLQARIKELALERRRFGYRRIHRLLKREGFDVNHKRVYRLYCELGLTVSKRRRRKSQCVEREPLLLPSVPNHTWSMDFVMDALSNGRRIKCLTIVDDYTKECLDIPVATGISGDEVVITLESIAAFRGYPEAIRTDQGPEFTGKALDQWAYQHGVILKLIQAGKPTQNAYIESFNGKFRDECLNEHWFRDLSHARDLISLWRMDYNENRPHSALGYLTPSEFAATTRTARNSGNLTSITNEVLD
ncbi:IS3 family transposase [Vibrio natriegens NBRC 15636 = ATCC 14048 = DSM 759]|nr:IS3 family transposase [Vibrio natriegens]MDX6029013.1 IS3 family transposase [Vibrio natriegens NBRC 15636 = ATCC 14048 = DSM 759]UUI14276.1 IS3 family transposase [Vibrio natriegens]WRS50916.1 IS3 family transposase [Vibrio natriegens NBRC 15636 = ATCC 14048 = DSM 759]